AVGGAARDDLHVAAALELGERARDVAADAAVQLPHPLVMLLPEIAEPEVLRGPGLLEVLAPFGARAPHVLVVEGQLLLEFRRGVPGVGAALPDARRRHRGTPAARDEPAGRRALRGGRGRSAARHAVSVPPGRRALSPRPRVALPARGRARAVDGGESRLLSV